MIVVTGIVEIADASRDQAMALAIEVARETRQEPGCISYGFYADIENPLRLRIYEEWEKRRSARKAFYDAAYGPLRRRHERHRSHFDGYFKIRGG